MTRIEDRRATFRRLHEAGCFVMPNPWDIGTTRYLQTLGFQALATTSAGFAFARGRPDMGVPLNDMLAHIGEIVAAADVPVNADFGAGFADAPGDVAVNVRRCIDTGVAGLSIEDATGDRDKPLYDFALALDRVRAARAALDEAGGGVVFTARAECFLTRHPEPLTEAIRRLVAFSEAGADCLFAPGVHTREDIAAIVEAVAPKPVNVLMTGAIGLTVQDLAGLGVRRISVGSSLAMAAWGGFQLAAKGIAEAGRFDGFPGAATYAEINSFFRNDAARRKPDGGD